MHLIYMPDGEKTKKAQLQFGRALTYNGDHTRDLVCVAHPQMHQELLLEAVSCS